MSSVLETIDWDSVYGDTDGAFGTIDPFGETPRVETVGSVDDYPASDMLDMTADIVVHKDVGVAKEIPVPLELTQASVYAADRLAAEVLVQAIRADDRAYEQVEFNKQFGDAILWAAGMHRGQP